MKAWGQSLDPDGKSGIRFLADPHAAFTKALDLDFDATKIFGQPRSKRYALVIADGKVKEAHVESDNTGVNCESMPCHDLCLSCLFRIKERSLLTRAASAVEKVLGGSHLQ